MQILMLAILTVLPDVTKEDMKKLLDAKMREETILAFIERNRPAQELSSDDVVELKRLGATDKVIQALLSARSAPAPEVREEVRVVRPRYYIYDPYPSYSYYYGHYGYPRHYSYGYPDSYRYRPHAHTYTRPERSFRSYLR